MKGALYFLILSSLILGSCRPEPYPEDAIETPVFKVQMMVNGMPIDLKAGQNSITLDSRVNHNSFGVHEFESGFYEAACNGCSPVFGVLVNGGEILFPNEPLNLDSTLIIGNYTFSIEENDSDFLTMDFFIPSSLMSAVSWDFGDGFLSSDLNPTHTYLTPGNYVVTLHVTENNGAGCDVLLSQTISVGEEQFSSASIDVSSTPGGPWLFSPAQQLPPNLIPQEWVINNIVYLGDVVSLNLDGDTLINACLTFFDQNTSEIGVSCIQFNPQQGEPCIDEFHYLWGAQNFNLGRIQLMYREGNNVYTSLSPLNLNPSSFFQITSVEGYNPGINGAPARRIQCIFDAWLVNVNNPMDEIHIEQGQATMGFIVD